MADRSLNVFYSGDKITIKSLERETLTLLVHRRLISRLSQNASEKTFSRTCTTKVWDEERVAHVPSAHLLVPGQQFVRSSAKFM